MKKYWKLLSLPVLFLSTPLYVSCVKNETVKNNGEETKNTEKTETEANNKTSDTNTTSASEKENLNNTASEKEKPNTSSEKEEVNNDTTENKQYEVLAKATKFQLTIDSSLNRINFTIILNKELENYSNYDEFKLLVNDKEYEISEINQDHGTNQYSGYIEVETKGNYKVIGIKNSKNQIIYSNNENNPEGISVTV